MKSCKRKLPDDNFRDVTGKRSLIIEESQHQRIIITYLSEVIMKKVKRS